MTSNKKLKKAYYKKVLKAWFKVGGVDNGPIGTT